MTPELNTLLKANNIDYSLLSEKLGLVKGQLKRYGAADNLTYKYKLIVNLAAAGIKIPYHHRPKCRLCNTPYVPQHHRQLICNECDNRQEFTLTVSDLLELGYSPKEVAVELGLPVDNKVLRLIAKWDDSRESYYIKKLRNILEE